MSHPVITLSLLILALGLLLEAKKHVPEDFSPHVKWLSKHRAAGWDEEFAYVTVRPKAHMFYWLQYTTHEDGHEKRPLVFWHQGGPGASSTGYGNMEIIGPEDIHGVYNNATWLQSVSIVYLDSPVGTGYSYVEEWSEFTTDIDEIADDLLAFAKVFYTSHPEFQTAPAYIFGESYGGKVAVTFAQALNKASEDGDVDCNLKGYALGNTWVSPMDSVNTWASLLYEMSCLDEFGLDFVNFWAGQAQKACDEGRWEDATDEWRNTQFAVMYETHGVDFYNILNYVNYSSAGSTYTRNGRQVYSTRRHKDLGLVYDVVLAPFQSDNLYDYMNKEAREKIGIIPESVTWSGQSGLVFQYQEGDFMKDTLSNIDDTLNNTDLHVIVYQGQLDLICDTKGAMQWVQKLKWPGLDEYNVELKDSLRDPYTGQVDTYYKAYNNFKFYWNLRAGHAVPQLMGPASLRMLERILNDLDRGNPQKRRGHPK